LIQFRGTKIKSPDRNLPIGKFGADLTTPIPDKDVQVSQSDFYADEIEYGYAWNSGLVISDELQVDQDGSMSGLP
jgi:hypothetical protein